MVDLLKLFICSIHRTPC